MKIFKIFDKSFILFLLVGASNTLLSAVLMFVLEDFGYWLSTAIAYIAGATLSFFLNKNFTFKNKEKGGKPIVKFAINVLVCYIIAYSLAQPIIEIALEYTIVSTIWRERVTKLFGMALYTLLNYFGQRFFAFRATQVFDDRQ